MTLKEAISVRHSVRKYLDRPLEAEKIAILKEALEKYNAEGGLNIQLVLEEPKAFSTGMFKYGVFSSARNYFVMAAPAGADEQIGYYGEYLVLLAQTLGLNTCWVGLTYKKIPGTYTLREGDKVYCVIALGYGESQGTQHPLKPLERFYEADNAPDWFLKGVEAAVLAPTAINQQKFKFILHPDGAVEAKALFSMAGYTEVDLGIVKAHFEIAVGKDQFIWK